MLFLPHESVAPGEEAQGLVEYALMLLLVALAVIIGLTAFGQAVEGLYQQVVNILPGSAGPNGSPDVESLSSLLRSIL